MKRTKEERSMSNGVIMTIIICVTIIALAFIGNYKDK